MVRRFCAAHQQEGIKIDQLLPHIAGKQVQIPKVQAAAQGIDGKTRVCAKLFYRRSFLPSPTTTPSI